MVPFCVASRTGSGGTISPPANGWISNRLSVSWETRWHIASTAPNIASRLFGQLAASRQRTGAAPCATAGAASAVAATPTPARLRNARLSILLSCRDLSGQRRPVRSFNLLVRRQKTLTQSGMRASESDAAPIVPRVNPVHVWSDRRSGRRCRHARGAFVPRQLYATGGGSRRFGNGGHGADGCAGSLGCRGADHLLGRRAFCV